MHKKPEWRLIEARKDIVKETKKENAQEARKEINELLKGQ